MLQPSPPRHVWSRPILRWAGSKRKLLPLLISRMPARFNRYFEPFAGSSCLFFAVRPKRAVLGDVNPDIITTYTILRAHPHLLYRAVSAIPNTSRTYYSIRKQQGTHPAGSFEKAVCFTYLNRFCFNGVFRTNKKGQFNVPRGTKAGIIPSFRSFNRCSIALRSAELRLLDFEECLCDARKGDFVYLDPPYATHKSRNRGEYGYSSFAHRDVDRLVKTLKRLDQKGVNFLLSYAATRSLREAVWKWNHTEVKVRRDVGGFDSARKIVREILVSNYENTTVDSKLPLAQ